METVLFLLGLTFGPLVINKTTERGRLEFVHKWLREIWVLFCILYTYYVIAKPEVRELAMSAYRRDAAWSYLIAFVIGGSLLCFYWWGSAKLLKETSSLPATELTSSGNQEFVSRLSALISEGNSLQTTCQGVPDPYKTPAQHRADLANAILGWKQRTENALTFDSDPRPLQMWKAAVLWSVPEKIPSIALYCTELNVKIDILNRILARKTITVQQRVGQLSRFISQGNSIQQACIDDDKSPDSQETQWMIRVMQWLGDNFDDNYAQDFNHALHTSAAMPGNHSPEIIAIWKRTHARIDVLTRIRQELTTPQK
ncbi:MAG TPA: hypothetical protein VGK24_11575 [Candidatus Angelobacter sp.]|jgi:hypothetical protein